MFDLHSHLLPGIDDGPATMAEALELARIAVQNGITHSILTPHIHPGRYENQKASIAAAVRGFREALVREGIPLRIGYAGEVRLSDEILGLVLDERIPFYGEYHGYRVMLLEFPHSHIPVGADKLVDWLLARKILPMIAHPERNKDVMRKLDKLRPFIDAECLFQVTAGSVAGDFGEAAQTTAQDLLELGVVTILASDAHNTQYRPPRLDHGVRAAAAIVGEAEARAMVTTRPAELCAAQFVRRKAPIKGSDPLKTPR